jgi:DNA primase
VRELTPNLTPERFNIKTMSARIAEKGDLWADFWTRRLKIEDVMERLGASLAGRKAGGS